VEALGSLVNTVTVQMLSADAEQTDSLKLRNRIKRTAD
jgi:hypothetical protein